MKHFQPLRLEELQKTRNSPYTETWELVSQCVGRVPRLEATGEPEGLNMVESELSVLVRQCLHAKNSPS